MRFLKGETLKKGSKIWKNPSSEPPPLVFGRSELEGGGGSVLIVLMFIVNASIRTYDCDCPPPLFRKSGDLISETSGPPEAKILCYLAVMRGETLQNRIILEVRRGRLKRGGTME